MVYLKRFIFFLFFSLPFFLDAQIQLVKNPNSKSFQLSGPAISTEIVVDRSDHKSVATAAKLFAGDITRVTNQTVPIVDIDEISSSNIVLVGTIENNQLIRELIRRKRISVQEIEDGWEQYLIQVIDNPFPKVHKALVVVGSDRRGAAYGIISVSEAIGVFPWYWWADVPVLKRKDLTINVDRTVSKTPSVRYRGIFINDEDWGLLPWAKKTFEPETNDIGPRTYEKVCELLLRLKGNYLSPAMHSASGAFNKYPENKVVADSFGIAMGSIHCEPLLFNNASEWDTKTMGPWDYSKNKDGINKQLIKRVRENGIYENVYTLALRGIHDAVMAGDLSLQKQAELLGVALKDQRQILDDNLDKPLEEIPQVFYPYKEVLDIYDAGLEVPDDVTFVWSDDDYGYMKRLSNTKEQQRKGRAGVYYHLSYWGPPNDNLWLCTTPPTLMYGELKKAYDTTADQLWVANVGDIKPAEYHISLFLEMAYDIDRFSYDNIVDHHADFLSQIFGKQYRSEFLDISKSYHKLAYVRKPEYMKNRRSDLFSVQHYDEADRRIREYAAMADKAEKILVQLDKDLYPSYFQLLYYNVKGSALFNQMWLESEKANWYAARNFVVANSLREEVVQYAEALQELTNTYNSLLDGKWKHMMALSNGGGRFAVPPMDSVTAAPNPSLGVTVSDLTDMKNSVEPYSLPMFNKFLPKSYHIDLFNKGLGMLDWRVEVKDDWIRLDKNSGSTREHDRVVVSVDWDKAPLGETIKSEINILSNGGNQKVFVSLLNPSTPSVEDLEKLYVEDNGIVAVDATGFHRKKETDEIHFSILEGLGMDNKVVMLGDPLAKNSLYPSLELTSNYVAPVRSSEFPMLEYDFYTFSEGPVDVYTYMVPQFPLNDETGSRYGVMLDNSPVYMPEASAPYYSTLWIQSILRNTRINKTTHVIDQPGKHKIKIFVGHPGVMLQKIVIDFGGMKRSYGGPEFTRNTETISR